MTFHTTIPYILPHAHSREPNNTYKALGAFPPYPLIYPLQSSHTILISTSRNSQTSFSYISVHPWTLTELAIMSFERQNGAVLATPPKLTLSSLPTHKALPPTPGTKTPPLHPMLSIPFQWEEAPGRPRSITNSSTPYKPRSFRCLDLPPRLLGEVPSSPTTVLDGPKAGRTLSHKFLLEDISPKSVTGSCELGLVDGPGLVKSVSENAVLDYYGPYKWDQMGGMKPHEDFGDLWVKNGSVRSEVDVEGRMMRFRRRTKGSLYKLSNKSTRLLENIYEGLRQMVSRKRKEGIKLGRTRAP